MFANIIAFFNGTFYLVNILLLFLGMLAGLKFLDHAAHLGGLLFGILWIRKGVEMVDPMIKQWHELRKNIMARRWCWNNPTVWKLKKFLLLLFYVKSIFDDNCYYFESFVDFSGMNNWWDFNRIKVFEIIKKERFESWFHIIFEYQRR